MKNISEIKPYSNEVEIVMLPASRIIGREIRNGGKLGNTAPQLWDEIYKSKEHEILESLPQIVSKDLFGWTMEYDPDTKTFVYMVCALSKAGTEVPEGFTYRDIPESVCAVGLYGESVNQTIKRVSVMGYEVNWSAEGLGWNAELYFHEEEMNPPKKVKTSWHWLIPVRKLN